MVRSLLPETNSQEYRNILMRKVDIIDSSYYQWALKIFNDREHYTQ